MKDSRKGAIIITGLTAPPEKHEYNTAKYFAERGFDVIFIPPRHIKGVPNPDFIMAGKIWETKSPLDYNKSSFEYIFKKATAQSDHIIFDLRRIRKYKDEQIYLNEIKKRSQWRKIKTLLVIDSNEKLLTIKGKFVSMEL